jgi:chromosome segregation ATPase
MKIEMKYLENEMKNLKVKIDIESVEKEVEYQNMKTQNENKIEKLNESICKTDSYVEKLFDLRFKILNLACNTLNEQLDKMFNEVLEGTGCHLSYTENKNVLFKEGISMYCKPDGLEWKSFSSLR